MRTHPLEILVSGICTAAALALALSAGAQAPAPEPKVESPQTAPMNVHHRHHPVPAHMMHHRDMHGTKGAMDCPMMMTEMGKTSEPVAEETQPTE